MNISKIEWVNVNDLYPHEDILIRIVEENIIRIKLHKKTIPIIVDKDTNVILDGHHRYYAFLILKLKKIPVFYVDYKSEEVIVNSWYRKIIPDITFSININGEYCVTHEKNRILCDNSLYKLYWLQHKLEQILIHNGYIVKKNNTEGLYIPPLPKEYITCIALKGLRFPPKSTRHEYKFYIAKEEIGINEY